MKENFSHFAVNLQIFVNSLLQLLENDIKLRQIDKYRNKVKKSVCVRDEVANSNSHTVKVTRNEISF